jgi:hypothetical protein
MNGTIVDDYSLQINTNNRLLLCVDCGFLSFLRNSKYKCKSSGMPLLGVGGNSLNGIGRVIVLD